MISVTHLTKQFSLSRRQRREMGSQFTGRTIEAAKDVSFICTPGRIFRLLGPNGAGKTTTLRLIATMLAPTSGSIAVAGFDTVRNPVDVRRRVGFLTGNTGLYAA